MFGLGVEQNLPLDELILQFDQTLGTPEMPAQEQAKVLAKFMVEEVAGKYQVKNDNQE